MITKTNVFNPICGLSAHQIVRLLEQGTAQNLSSSTHDLAIAAIQEHLNHIPEATLKTVLNCLFSVTALRGFASVACKSFLGEDKSQYPIEHIA